MVAMIENIPISRLAPHPLNPRRTPAGLPADDELVASIAASGVLHNLVVERSKENERVYLVVDGNRRLQALQSLIDSDLYPDQWTSLTTVPCRVLPPDVPATEASLAANTVRVAMHPADQIEAFSALVDMGYDYARIASRFGITERLAMQRIRLGAVAQQIRDAYRAGDISMEMLEAFASTEDQERQLRAWKTVRRNRRGSNQYMVRQMLDDHRTSAAHFITRYVGLDAYEAAGGGVERDLFDEADATYLTDTTLLRELAHAKLVEAAGDRAKRWAWIDTTTEHLDIRRDYVVAQPILPQLTPDEVQERDRLQAVFERAVEANDWGAQHDCRTKSRALKAQIDKRNDWSPEVRAVAGCVVELTWEGEVLVHRGLYRRGDEPAADAAAPAEDAAPAAAQEPGPADPAPDGPSLLPARVLKALRSERFEHIRAAWRLRDALDVVAYTMASEIIGQAVGRRRAPGLIRFGGRLRAECSDESVLRAAVDLNTNWLDADDPWQAFRDLSPVQRSLTLKVAVGAMLRPQLASDPAPDPVLEDLAASVKWAEVRPTAEGYWRLFTKAQILEAVSEQLGEGWAQRHRKLKKSELAAAAEAAFASDSDIFIDDYTIPGFAPEETG